MKINFCFWQRSKYTKQQVRAHKTVLRITDPLSGKFVLIVTKLSERLSEEEGRNISLPRMVSRRPGVKQVHRRGCRIFVLSPAQTDICRKWHSDQLHLRQVLCLGLSRAAARMINPPSSFVFKADGYVSFACHSFHCWPSLTQKPTIVLILAT
jgi:hypothetical protein